MSTILAIWAFITAHAPAGALTWLGATAAVNLLFKLKSDDQWDALAESNPRVHAVCDTLRKGGVQPIEVIAALRRIFSGNGAPPSAMLTGSTAPARRFLEDPRINVRSTGVLKSTHYPRAFYAPAQALLSALVIAVTLVAATPGCGALSSWWSHGGANTVEQDTVNIIKEAFEGKTPAQIAVDLGIDLAVVIATLLASADPAVHSTHAYLSAVHTRDAMLAFPRDAGADASPEAGK